jgi:predicted GH43/DUF377 family glycosyl hydrolase
MRKLIALFTLTAASYAASVAITATRLSDQPLLKPTAGWMAAGVFNTAAVRKGGKTILLFRAQDQKGVSRIGYAESLDGLHFTIRPEPVLAPEAPYEKGGGVEDPRVVMINGTYYLTYTAYDGHSAQLALAVSKDLIHWDRKGILLPAYKGTWNTQWTKSGAIIPNQVNGKWWMYYLGTRTDSDGKPRDYMGLAESTDLLHWKDATKKPVLDRRPDAFDSRVMEPGPAPIITPQGILLLYNGANEALVYGPGWVLFDKNDPRKVIARADAPFILPRLSWERSGQVPNVIFIEGDLVNLNKGNRLALTGYYGAADKYIGAMDIRVHLSQ